MAEHVVPQRIYYLVFLALIALTATTVAAAFLDIGRLHLPVALTIAIAKATLVALFFMHVYYSSRLTWLFVMAGLFWFGILLVLTLSDYVSRSWQITPGM